MHLKVDCSPVYNRQDMETTYMSIYWMYKEDVVHINSGILLPPQKNEILPFASVWKIANAEWC